MMKKNITKSLLMLLTVGLFTACSSDNDITVTADEVLTPITITARYGDGNAQATRVGYTEDGTDINASWETGDQLYVVYNGRVNTLSLNEGAGTATATFSGSIQGSPSSTAMLICYVKDKNVADGKVTINTDGSYTYSSDAFLSQDGTVAGAAKCNLYNGTTFYGTGEDLSVAFSVNTSMLKFNVIAPDAVSEGTQGATLTYKSGETVLAQATFTVGAGGNNTLYLAVPAGQYSGAQTLVYESGSTIESKTLSDTKATFKAGQTYSKKLIYSNAIYVPLTFEARIANSTVTFNDETHHINMQYSKNGGEWTSCSSGTAITLENVGDYVSFSGNNENFSTDSRRRAYFSCTGQCYISGNIMSLLNQTYFANSTELTQREFYALFKDNTAIYSNPSQPLLLPATTLAPSCYYEMFSGCTNLTVAPALPAETLALDCYNEMFSGCTNLTAAPALPAETLVERCYTSMFKGCTSLTTAPALPATTLAQDCYRGMFNGCTSLTTAPALPATTLAQNCYSSMFLGCTSLTTAPVLPATILSRFCYYYMFNGCTNLNSVVCLATDRSAGSCTDYWLVGVSETGTFTKAANATWPSGVYGIPSGWTVVDATE